MSKHLGSLKRLHQKLAVALGENHPHVQQLQVEIGSYAASLPRPGRCQFAAPRCEIGRSINYRWKHLSESST